MADHGPLRASTGPLVYEIKLSRKRRAPRRDLGLILTIILAPPLAWLALVLILISR